jgi:hypothetical protein
MIDIFVCAVFVSKSTPFGLPQAAESGSLFSSVGRYAVKVRPLLVDNVRFRLVNKPGCQHEKIGACVPLTTIIGV